MTGKPAFLLNEQLTDINQLLVTDELLEFAMGNNNQLKFQISGKLIIGKFSEASIYGTCYCTSN
jgi:hypothetical protein